MNDQESEVEKEQDLCESHYFLSTDVATAEFRLGNSKCRRTTRFMLHCAHCGLVRFIEDPEAPVLKHR